MKTRIRMPCLAASFACIAAAVAGCANAPGNDATIEERSQAAGAAARAVSPAPAPAAAPAPVREAHDGVYVVQPGDTAYSIALAFGRDIHDIAQWNGLDDPTHIHVGQALRVAPPAVAAPADESAAAPAEATAVPIAPSGAVESHPLAPAALPAPAAAATTPAAAPPSAPPAPAEAPAPAAPDQASAAAPPTADKGPAGEPAGAWTWPSQGRLLQRFDETAGSKGIDIAGKVGDPVYAASDGQVVYSGRSLPGYGKLVIIKHTDELVSAYGNNNEILVTQGQEVKRGQRIADLGMTDAPNPRLHFEIRRRGTPIDPLTYLPPR